MGWFLQRGSVVALVACAAGCGVPPPSPGEIANNYVSAIAEGNFSDACAMLSTRARQSLSAAMRSPAGCPTLLARCLPTRATVLQKDQVQLFYANVEETISGSKATVRTSGTTVANKVAELSFLSRHGNWTLVSYGRQRCKGAGAGTRGGRRRSAHRHQP